MRCDKLRSPTLSGLPRRPRVMPLVRRQTLSVRSRSSAWSQGRSSSAKYAASRSGTGSVPPIAHSPSVRSASRSITGRRCSRIFTAPRRYFSTASTVSDGRAAADIFERDREQRHALGEGRGLVPGSSVAALLECIGEMFDELGGLKHGHCGNLRAREFLERHAEGITRAACVKRKLLKYISNFDLFRIA